MSDDARPPEQLTTAEDAGRAASEARSLIDQGKATDAISFAELLRGNDVAVAHVRAYAYTEAGEDLRDSDLVARGAELWRSLEGRTLDWIYNLGNAELALFEIAVAQKGPAEAFTSDRQHLHEARSCFKHAGETATLPSDLRLQAFTNLGNSFSQIGRDLEAIESWQRAFEIDPNFAMAHANVAVALERVAPFAGAHVAAVVHEAAAELDRALEGRDDIVRFGGPSALRRFEALRERLPANPSPHVHESQPWTDPHLQWCRDHELFLHVSQVCLREHTEMLDPLFFKSLSGGFKGRDDRWANELFDAYNALKQGYVSARYLAWLGTASDTTLGQSLDAVRQRVAFFDTQLGARFGIRTGIVLQAFAAAANVLDQVAVFIHLYFETNRPPRSINFRRIWGDGPTVDTTLASWLSKERFNRGLYALIDLACDLERDSLLDELIERRHTLTHRFVVAHDFVLEDEDQRDRNVSLERIEWSTIADQTMSALRIARASLIYAARTIDAAEASRSQTREGPVVDIPIAPLDPSMSEA